jgi:hypothetical protein
MTEKKTIAARCLRLAQSSTKSCEKSHKQAGILDCQSLLGVAICCSFAILQISRLQALHYFQVDISICFYNLKFTLICPLMLQSVSSGPPWQQLHRWVPRRSYFSTWGWSPKRCQDKLGLMPATYPMLHDLQPRMTESHRTSKWGYWIHVTRQLIKVWSTGLIASKLVNFCGGCQNHTFPQTHYHADTRILSHDEYRPWPGFT